MKQHAPPRLQHLLREPIKNIPLRHWINTLQSLGRRRQKMARASALPGLQKMARASAGCGHLPVLQKMARASALPVLHGPKQVPPGTQTEFPHFPTGQAVEPTKPQLLQEKQLLQQKQQLEELRQQQFRDKLQQHWKRLENLPMPPKLDEDENEKLYPEQQPPSVFEFTNSDGVVYVGIHF
jgi:hypothetical protein